MKKITQVCFWAFTLYLSFMEAQAQVGLSVAKVAKKIAPPVHVKFKAGTSTNVSPFNVDYNLVGQLHAHHKTVEPIVKQVTGMPFPFEEYEKFLDRKKNIFNQSIFAIANLELDQWPVYATIGCGNSQFDFNSTTWWTGVGINPVLFGDEETSSLVLNIEALRQVDNAFDEDALIASMGADKDFTKNLKSFFTATGALGKRDAFMGFLSLSYKFAFDNETTSMTVGPFVKLDFSKSTDRPTGANQTCYGMRLAFDVEVKKKTKD